MARTAPRARPDREQVLETVHAHCPACGGRLRYREHKSVPEIHRGLRERGVAIAERTVTHLLDRYDELVATSAADDDRLRAVLAGQGRAILALDGLQPDVGHEVLWVVRECLSGEV